MEVHKTSVEPKLNEIQGAVHSIFSKLVSMEEKYGKYINVVGAQASELTEIRKDQEHLYRYMKTFHTSTSLLLERMMELQAGINALLKHHKSVTRNIAAKNLIDK